MTHTPQRTERLHALDSLRAIMMLLGLVLHSAVSYGAIDYGEAWSLKDPETTSPFFDLLVGYIHAFRMPVFFAIAGFFGALLFYERSPRAMARNRLSRIVYPFVVFVVLLWPPVVFAWVFTSSVMTGAGAPLNDAVAAVSNPLVVIPANPMHLWFLVYLIFFSFAGGILGLLMRRLPTVSSHVRRVYELLMRSPALRPLAFAALTFGLLALMDTRWPEKTGGFLPAWKPLCNYFTFYLFGWLLYGSRQLVTGLARHVWPIVIIASALFLAKAVLAESLSGMASMALNALTVWCFVFGITGLFVRYFNESLGDDAIRLGRLLLVLPDSPATDRSWRRPADRLGPACRGQVRAGARRHEHCLLGDVFLPGTQHIRRRIPERQEVSASSAPCPISVGPQAYCPFTRPNRILGRIAHFDVAG